MADPSFPLCIAPAGPPRVAWRGLMRAREYRKGQQPGRRRWRLTGPDWRVTTRRSRRWRDCAISLAFGDPVLVRRGIDQLSCHVPAKSRPSPGQVPGSAKARPRLGQGSANSRPRPSQVLAKSAPLPGAETLPTRRS
jgi:hypothetical protein